MGTSDKSSGKDRINPDEILFPMADSSAASSDFEVIEQIGHGGMGAVYKAIQPQLNRTIALKVLPVQEDDSFSQRFQREAQALAALDHPNIVAVYDFGTSDEGMHYLAMEHVEGSDLWSILSSQTEPLEEGWIVSCAVQICDALIYAHAKGVIHRDIKPNNILLDVHGRVRVVDFGLAKVLGDNAQGVALTMSGMGMGTMDYAAPEQMVQSAEVDGRADIYSLGVTLYQLFTRKLPRGAFFAPSVERPGLSPRIDEIILTALASEADERYQSVEQMRDDLLAISQPQAEPTSIVDDMPPPTLQASEMPKPTVQAAETTGPKFILGEAAGSSTTAKAKITKPAVGTPELDSDEAKRRKAFRGYLAVAIVGVLAIAVGLVFKLVNTDEPGSDLVDAKPQAVATPDPSADQPGTEIRSPLAAVPLRLEGHIGTIAVWARAGAKHLDIEQGIGAVPSDAEEVVALCHGNAGFISANDSHGLAIHKDGSVSAWGNNSAGQADVPKGLGSVVEVAAGAGHSLALLEDGTVRAWGNSAPVPAALSETISISAGMKHSVALQRDGTIAAWGENNLSQVSVPKKLAGAAAVACGANHTVALLADGSVVAWGDDRKEQCQVPADLSDVSAISALADSSWALKKDGTLVAWGAAQLSGNNETVGWDLRRFIHKKRIEPAALLLTGNHPSDSGSFDLDNPPAVGRLLKEAHSLLAGDRQLIALISPRWAANRAGDEATQAAKTSALAEASAGTPDPIELTPSTEDKGMSPGQEKTSDKSAGTGLKPGALLLVGDIFKTRQTAFDERFRAEATTPFTTGLATLDNQYLGNLEKLREGARKAGSNAEADQIEVEIGLHKAGKIKQSQSADELPLTVSRARKVYRTEFGKLTASYRKNARQLVKAYMVELEDYQKELIRLGQLEQAVAIKTYLGSVSEKFERLPIVIGAEADTSAKGRYVRIELEGDDRILELVEIQVLSGGQNLALWGQAEQSSERQDWHAGRAIDGIISAEEKDQSISHTKPSSDPWWQLDLGSEQSIDAIAVHTRPGQSARFEGARVLVLDEDGKITRKTQPLKGRKETTVVMLSKNARALLNVARLRHSSPIRLTVPDSSSMAPVTIQDTQSIHKMNDSSLAAPTFGQSFENTAGITMMGLEPGTFVMAHEGGKWNHQAILTHGYWLGKHEVTREQWLKVASDLEISSQQVNIEPKGKELPISNIWPEDVREFCRRLTRDESRRGLIPEGFEYRLPTEAQWRYACQAGTTGPLYDANYADIAWPVADRNIGKLLNPVGKKKPNAWGLHDMIGNIPELVLDVPGDYDGNTVFNPQRGPATILNDGEDRESYLFVGGGDKVWHRGWSSVPAETLDSYSGHTLGFRVALVPAAAIPPEPRDFVPAIEDHVSGRQWNQAYAIIDTLVEEASIGGFPNIADQASLLRELVSLAESQLDSSHFPTSSRERTESGQRYLVVPISLTWDEAETFARSFGGHLATVTSKEELEFAIKELPGQSGYVWLGASGRRTMKWINKEKWGYANWGAEQPDNAQEWSRRFGVCMELGGEGTWRDMAQEQRLPFLLEWDARR
jgi:serine/threonine protein kinase/formylglycine-generating enzyme required for sulfatase activity